MSVVATLVIAFAIDALGGDPPNRFHPVAWMGNWISLGKKLAPHGGSTIRLLFGFLWVVGSLSAVGWIAWLMQVWLMTLPFLISVVLQAFVLKCMFSARSLSNAAAHVSRALHQEDVVEARRQLSYHLVSRNTENLTVSQVSAATIESVAENTSDSIVAPLFFFAICGLPGAAVYRFANTFDAMWGYRNAEFEWLGKTAARLDDLLNLIPARITAAMMLLAAWFMGLPWMQGLRVWWRDRYLTPSPNAGHPMSVAAGVLGVRLDKIDCYTLGQELQLPDTQSVDLSVRCMWFTSCLWISLICLIHAAIAWSIS